MLVYDEKMSIYFWRIAIVTGVSPSRDSKIRGAIVRIAKTNTILKRPVNEILTVENTYHDTNQTGNTRKEKRRQETAVIGEQKRIYGC